MEQLTENELLGKTFELLNLGNLVIERFIINYVREETTPAIEHSDGSTSPSNSYILVSENGAGWHRIYGGKTDRII